MRISRGEETPRKTLIVDNIVDLKEIGAGTFGKIYAYNYKNKKMALKEFNCGNGFFHSTTLREIRAMNLINSEYVLNIINILVCKSKIYLLFDLFDYDLYKIISIENFTLNDIRHIFWQILKGVEAIYEKDYIHRDLKTANILIKKINLTDDEEIENSKRYKRELERTDEKEHIDNQNNLKADNYQFSKSLYSIKICDLGSARPNNREMTPGVVTLWYRAPELLLGANNYTMSADIWSLGCILLEFFNKKPVFKASIEVDELDIISDYCGSIDKDSMPDCINYPLFSRYNLRTSNRNILERFSRFSPLAIDLADKMLTLNPSKRPTIRKCLDHEFFKTC